MSRALLAACIFLAGAGLLLAGIGKIVLFPDPVQFAYRAAFLGGLAGTAGAWAARRFLGPRRADGLVANLVLAAVTVLIGLAAAELALRYAFREITTTADIRSWFATRWYAGITRNSLGFREREIEATKAPGTTRIAVIGDSFTIGQGLGREERFTEILEKALNGTAPVGRRYQVLNFGRGGAETVDHLEILEEFVLDLDPDFVLLQWYENDPEGRDKSLRPRPIRLVPSDYLTGFLRRHSVLHFLLQRQWTSLQQAIGWMGSYQQYMEARFGDPESPASREARDALQAFFRACREAGVPVGMVLFPDFGGLTDLAFLHERVLDQCSREGIPCLDLSGKFEDAEDPSALWASPFDPHPGPVPNRIAAEAIVEIFGERFGSARRPAGVEPPEEGGPQ